jgi:hypothetical protein
VSSYAEVLGGFSDPSVPSLPISVQSLSTRHYSATTAYGIQGSNFDKWGIAKPEGIRRCYPAARANVACCFGRLRDEYRPLSRMSRLSGPEKHAADGRNMPLLLRATIRRNIWYVLEPFWVVTTYSVRLDARRLLLDDPWFKSSSDHFLRVCGQASVRCSNSGAADVIGFYANVAASTPRQSRAYTQIFHSKRCLAVQLIWSTSPLCFNCRQSAGNNSPIVSSFLRSEALHTLR